MDSIEELKQRVAELELKARIAELELQIAKLEAELEALKRPTYTITYGGSECSSADVILGELKALANA